MNYYQETIKRIEELIDEKNYDLAKSLIEEELRMPYIPSDVLETLEALNCEIKISQKGNESLRKLSDEEIREYLFLDDFSQYLAVYNLKDQNLRNYISEIKKYLSKSLNKHCSAIIIDELIRQEINDEFEYTLNGQTITFNPRYIEPFEDLDSFKLAHQLLSDEMENDNPSMYEMSKKILVEEFYLNLPMHFDELEIEYLIHSIIYYIYGLFDENLKLKYQNKHSIDLRYLIKLNIENEQ